MPSDVRFGVQGVPTRNRRVAGASVFDPHHHCFTVFAGRPVREFSVQDLDGANDLFGLYALATVGGGLKGAASEIIKIATTVVTIVAVALLIRSRGDFIAGVVGLSAAAGLMGMYGINALSDPSQGGSALDVGNKNAFSLFVLPPMLVGGYLILDMPVKRKALRMLLKVLMVITVSTCALAIFLSGNRSGYLGCVIIAGMLLKEKKLYGLLLVGMVAAALVYIMMVFEMTGVFEQRWKQTFVERNVSDEMRGHIIMACIELGFEYPLAGVSCAAAADGHRFENQFDTQWFRHDRIAQCFRPHLGVVRHDLFCFAGVHRLDDVDPARCQKQAGSAAATRVPAGPPAAQNDGSVVDDAGSVYQQYPL